MACALSALGGGRGAPLGFRRGPRHGKAQQGKRGRRDERVPSLAFEDADVGLFISRCALLSGAGFVARGLPARIHACPCRLMRRSLAKQGGPLLPTTTSVSSVARAYWVPLPPRSRILLTAYAPVRYPSPETQLALGYGRSTRTPAVLIYRLSHDLVTFPVISPNKYRLHNLQHDDFLKRFFLLRADPSVLANQCATMQRYFSAIDVPSSGLRPFRLPSPSQNHVVPKTETGWMPACLPPASCLLPPPPACARKSSLLVNHCVEIHAWFPHPLSGYAYLGRTRFKL